MDTRIDFYPTHEHAGYKLRPGKPYPFGATLVPGGVNFSIFSRHATACTLVLFEKRARAPLAEIPFPHAFRVGNVYCMVVFDLDVENIEYGYRMDGPWAPSAGHRFDPKRFLLDPYAKAVSGRDTWGRPPDWNDPFQYRGRLVFEDFDWEDDHAIETPAEDLVIYEAHVRSFTRHPSAGVKFPGTYAALIEKIPYLTELGVNCVELMPVYEFDEFENARADPVTGETLYNYWGYSTIGFFAPKAGFAATGRFGMQADEFKNMVKHLHRAGIEVLLDVVFNHTAEGDQRGPTISFRGVDNSTYYMLTPEGYYFNFSGCGNTLNCNNPIVRTMVLDCLRYWASEYHVDGFRFDLAAILGRDPWGAPLPNPPLLETLAFDPVLGKCKLIAEAWDAGGLNLLGAFPAYGRWAEWNGKFRDDVRRFLRGDAGMVGRMGQRLQGSPDLYGRLNRGPTASVNFITCHDGFTLHDFCAYNAKHNETNGENNRDGSDDNFSWNCGCEGDAVNPDITWLRRKQAKNAAAILMVSQGVPMILMGDEIGRTQRGNNNAYCHDSDLNWLDWALAGKNAELLRFFQRMIAFRRAHPALRSQTHFRNCDYVGSGVADITWHGVQKWNADWSDSSRALAFMLDGRHAKGGTAKDQTIYVALNAYWEGLTYSLPDPPAGTAWHVFANTGLTCPNDICDPGQELRLQSQSEFLVGPRSVVILVSK
jgi:glycogen operon protein